MSPAARAATRAATRSASRVAARSAARPAATLTAFAAIVLLPATAAVIDVTPVLPGYPLVLLRTAREIGGAGVVGGDAAGGCVSEGRWYRAGAAVAVRDACLRCACGAGALQCRRRACAAPPAPPPRCHLRYRRDACCPELHCPDGITVLENAASARMEDDTDYSTPILSSHVCVEEGAAWASGSALAARAACEACYCMRGRRRCVRPRCLPPPPHCRAQPAPGACCPQRYYCDHNATAASSTPALHSKHDCLLEGVWAREGTRVSAAERDACTRCFCLRGAVRCQPPACAPPVPGCRPLLRPGDCCPHRYLCDHRSESPLTSLSQNALELEQIEDRSFHSSRSSKIESTTTTTQPTKFVMTQKSSKSAVAAENLLTTTKVKRKTSDPPPASTTVQASTTTAVVTTVATTPTTTATPSSTTELTTTDKVSETTLADQPESSMKIMINGTINCTAELSSTALSSAETVNKTEMIIKESLGRVPVATVTSAAETRTSSPVDIITHGYMGDGLEDGESFTINVTSSLNTNTNASTTRTTDLPKLSTNSVHVLNTSDKKTKGDYDYDYAEPTLPPSLPNLKIIPFVAADAVLDDEPPKQSSYGSLEREDKFPVYFPSIDTKETFATKREDVTIPTQYPVFTPEKQLSAVYPSVDHDVSFNNNAYPSAENDIGDIYHEYTITASLGNRIPVHGKSSTKTTTSPPTFSVEAPAVNLFSPPVETEGGFVPKGPGGIIDEYFAVYPSTPPGPPIPHLTTSMQLDNTQGECLASNGRRVMEGESISLACSVCTCAWGEMHCSPRPCHTPAGCSRRPASINSADLCCGHLVCDHGNKTSPNDAVTLLPSRNTEVSLNESKIPESNITYIQKENVSVTEINNGTATNSPANVSSTGLNTTVRYSSTTSMSIVTSNVSTTTPSTLNITNVTTTTQGPKQKLGVTPPPATSVAPDNSTDYEEDEDDEGFSFGSVLKLLLSDSYDTTTSTTTTSKKAYVTSAASTKPTSPKWQAIQTSTTTTRRPSQMPTTAAFVPIPPRYPFSPPKLNPPKTLVNRIDHLVLGEATAIKKPTLRPSAEIPSITSFKPIQSSTTSTQKTTVYSRPNEIKDDRTANVNVKNQSRPTSTEGSTQSSPAATEMTAAVVGGSGSGLLKLAGCNIYGRMYGVGRVITELSSACQECRCTDLGVQCRALAC